jgi:4-carboxymuconolactone decarboxylase
MPDYELTLRMLALNDERSVAALLAQGDFESSGGCSDPQVRALVRLAALIAISGAPASYQSAVDAALAAGAPVEDLIGVLIAVATTIGSARVVAAAPRLARAVGFDIDAAIDGEDAPSSPNRHETDQGTPWVAR